MSVVWRPGLEWLEKVLLLALQALSSDTEDKLFLFQISGATTTLNWTVKNIARL